VAQQPTSKIASLHLSQILSPTVSAAELVETWGRVSTGEQRRNFYNRKLGAPYADADQIPVTIPILKKCQEEGRAAGVAWLERATGT